MDVLALCQHEIQKLIICSVPVCYHLFCLPAAVAGAEMNFQSIQQRGPHRLVFVQLFEEFDNMQGLFVGLNAGADKRLQQVFIAVAKLIIKKLCTAVIINAVHDDELQLESHLVVICVVVYV